MKKITSVKNHVVRNRGKYAVLATATVCLAINRRSLREHDAFLAEKGLLNEFYAPEE